MEDWLLLQNGIWLYITLFVALFGGVFGLPIPEDIPLIISGVLVQQGRADLGIIFIVCYTAVILGDIVIYRIGNKLGPALFVQRWFRRRVALSKIKKLRSDLERRSFVMIFFARHLFYLRTITFLVCGAVKMSFIRFLIADMISALISLPVMFSIGYMGAEHFDTILDQISSFKKGFVIVSLFLILLSVYIYRKRQDLIRKALEADAENSDEADQENNDN